MGLFKKKYTEKELIDFGNYLLSKERHNRIKYHDGKVQPNYHETKKEVHHADVENFKSAERCKKAVGGIIIVKPKLIKRFGFAMLCLFFIGCNRPLKNYETIAYKSGMDFWGAKLPLGWCQFQTDNGNHFQDSCHYYYYKDTIN